MRLLGLENFASMVLPLERLHSHPLQFWLRETVNSQADLFKSLKLNQKVRWTLIWWHSFVQCLKAIHHHLVEEKISRYLQESMHELSEWLVLQRQVSREKWQDDTHQYPETQDSLEGLPNVLRWNHREVVFLQINNTTTVAYWKKESDTHCKKLYGLVRKILLKCLREGVTACPEYLWAVANLKAYALSRKIQEWSLGDPACCRLFLVHQEGCHNLCHCYVWQCTMFLNFCLGV